MQYTDKSLVWVDGDECYRVQGAREGCVSIGRLSFGDDSLTGTIEGDAIAKRLSLVEVGDITGISVAKDIQHYRVCKIILDPDWIIWLEPIPVVGAKIFLLIDKEMCLLHLICKGEKESVV